MIRSIFSSCHHVSYYGQACKLQKSEENIPLSGLERMPAKPKKEIIRSRKRPKPAGPDQLWQADMTYIWCGQDRWCYLFNVLDAFTREWVGYAFEPRAVTDGAIAALTVSFGIQETGLLKACFKNQQRLPVYFSAIWQGCKSIRYEVRIHPLSHARAK